jgi:hypothetical protein
LFDATTFVTQHILPAKHFKMNKNIKYRKIRSCLSHWPVYSTGCHNFQNLLHVTKLVLARKKRYALQKIGTHCVHVTTGKLLE